MNKILIGFRKKILGIILLSFVSTPLYPQIEKINIEFERLSDRVLIVWGGKVSKDQIVAISSEKGIVLIDAGKCSTLAEEYRKIIERELGKNDFKYLINTHYHFDHTGGNQVFSEAEIIAHQKTPQLMKDWDTNRQNFIETRRNNQMVNWTKQRDDSEPGSEQWERYNDIVTTGVVMLDDYEHNFELTLPGITFNDRMTLDLGDITLKLYYWGEGLHTGDDILIYCPEEKLLFSGDLFYKEALAISYRPSFDGERQIKVLDDILNNENNVKWVYDCHNGRMSGNFISLYHKYTKDVWSLLKEAKVNREKFETVLNNYSYEKKFSYIAESGLEEDVLKRGHINNLKFTWYCVNNMQSAAELLSKIIDESSIGDALKKYSELKDQYEPNYFFDENEFNRLGYRLISQDKIFEAVEIFKINVEKYPGSFNVYDSLGEALMKAGNNSEAIEAYEKSLQLNPLNSNAEEQLRLLKNSKN